MQTDILYTAIPDPSYPGPGLRLTVLISPRLIGPPTSELSQYPTFLDWPSILPGLTFQVDIAGWARDAQVDVETLDSTLWRRLFPSYCLVRSWGFVDLLNSDVLEFPASAIDRRLLDVYRTVAASGTKLPRVLDVDDVHDYQPNVVDRLLLDYEAAAAAIVNPTLVAGLSADARVVYQGLRFYRRSTDADIDVPADEPELDFHQRVALLGDHPTMLRRCGLAFDLVVPGVDLGTIPPQGEIRVLPQWRDGSNGADLCPQTVYDTRSGRFNVASGGGMVADGYMAVGNGDVSVVQLDGDGALLQVATTMGSIREMLIDPHSPPQHDQALPALRSAGITLLHAGRAGWLEARLREQREFDAVPAVVSLDADDLLRGWRIDVEIDGNWHSLHRRHGVVYGDDNVPLVEIFPDDDEEGYVKAASATSPTFRPSELYLHEAVAGWSGWSLSGSRPGKAMEFVPEVRDASNNVIAPASERKIENHNDPGSMPLYTRYRATPGSLPKLRFGQTYRLRARAVDLAGGGLPHDDPGTAHTIGPIRYERFEPVPPPLVVPAAVLAPAESLEHMVVCTDPAGTQTYQVLTNVRHVLAPKGALDMWERHGMIEGAFSWDPDVYYRLIRRERGTLLEPFIDTLAGRVTVTDRQLCNPASLPDQSTAWPTERGAPLGQGQYVICTGERVRLPWLPDRQAAGVVVWNAHDPLETPVIRLFQTVAGADPLEAEIDLDSLKIVLHTADAGTPARIRDSDAMDREIHVELPPGDRMELRYASLPRDVNLMALWNLMTEADRQGVARAIEEGQHWMFSPARTLTLVHAAQRPVLGPRFESLAISRWAGEARARFDATLSAHAHSTSHVDVRARWLEVRDDGDVGPSEAVAESDVCRIAFGYDDTVVSTSKTVQLVERRPGPTRFGTLLDEQLRAPDAVDTWHDLPDTRRRIVTYTPIGTTRWQEYFPLDVIADPHSQTVSNLQTAGSPHPPMSIPASAAPDAPHVAQILPTFRREGSARTRSRSGNGLRIYLERPWFSSGVGERLAILVERDAVWPPQPTPVDWLEKISRWGADPVWTRPAPHPRPLSTSAFVIDPNDGVPAFGGLEARARVEVVPEIGGAPVDAIVVVPELSEERQQWYCDLELGGLTYFPFLSLALARYQEDALPGCHLSPVVRAELVQLAPDRFASVTVSPNGKKATVIVRGVSAGNLHEAQHTGNPGGAHRVRARVEHPKAGGTELDWAVHAEDDLVAQWANADEIEWSVTLPVKPTVAWRIVIEERELYDGGDRITYVEILTRT
jgi:hypothetical protein